METVWLSEAQLARALARHEAFWRGELEQGPLLWVTAQNAKPGPRVPEPGTEAELWTNVDYVMAATESALARTHYAGDALPVFCPWLGPDQFAGWLGAELILRPRANTSWSVPFVKDWDAHPEFRHGDAADLKQELDALCPALDLNRLFLWAIVDSPSQADDLVAYVQRRAPSGQAGRSGSQRTLRRAVQPGRFAPFGRLAG
jgi:hypothetical protein